MIDAGLVDYVSAQRPVAILLPRPLPKDEVAAFRSAPTIRWSGAERFSELPGAMSYFPGLYAPQAVALELGRWAGATVEESVLWARLANGLVAIALVALGLRLLPFGHSLVLVLLLLPRTLLQFASNSADPILYGFALVVVALGLRQTTRLKPVAQNGCGGRRFVPRRIRTTTDRRARLHAGGSSNSEPAMAEPPFARRRRCGRCLVGADGHGAGQVDLRCGVGSSPVGPRLAAFATGWPRTARP